MGRWHRFNQDEGPFDPEYSSWSKVMPGDIVQSRGTLAWRAKDFAHRSTDTKVLELHSSPVFILARIPGIPGETHESVDEVSRYLTFVCLSRHGFLIVLGRQA